MSTPRALREEVRRRYAEAARAVAAGPSCGCCGSSCCDGDEARGFGASLSTAAQRSELPAAAALASLGCGNPTGALSRGEYEAGLEAAGLVDVAVRFTHEVADGMHGAVVRARKPGWAPPQQRAGAGG